MILRLYDHRSMEVVLKRANGRRGAGVLRRAISELAEPPDVRSELERRFLALMRRSELAMPTTNLRVSGHEVDFCWPEQRLIVETDGRRTHGTPQAFERDRQRDLELARAGWQVLRISWRQVVKRPEQIVATLHRRLSVAP